MTAPRTRNRLIPVLALTAATLVIGATTLVAGGCSDTSAEQPNLAAELSAIRQSIDESREPTERLTNEMKRLNRRMDDLSNRVAELGSRPAAVAAHGAGGEGTGHGTAAGATEPGDTGAAATASPELTSEVAAVLASEDGRKVVAAAARGVLEDRDRKQRDGFVAYSLAKFAEEAGLNERQTRDVRQVWDDVMTDARKLIADSAPKPGMSAEERAEKVLQIRTGMQDLGKRREERMKGLLDDTQYELYVKRQEEIDAGIHGAPAGARRRPAEDDGSTSE